MNIKKNSKTSVLIESPFHEAKIESLFYKGTIVTKIIRSDKTIEISKPGDYEYSHIGFTGFEVTSSTYKGVVNMSKLVLEDITVAIIFADNEINKEILNELVNVDILISPFFSATRLKEHIAGIDPKTLLTLKDFENSQEFDIEDLKKTLGVSLMEEATNYKFKNTDFANDGEYTLSTFILK